MDRVRGGVFSGAMVLAGLSATLLSALIAIGIRQVTVRADHPVQVTMVPSSGQVAVPDVTPTPTPTPAVKPSATPASQSYGSYGSYGSSSGGTAPVTGSRAGGGSVTTRKPVTAPTTSKPAAPTPSPTPTKHGHGNGAANGTGNGNGHKR